MQCDELSAREEFTYSHMSTLERESETLGRRDNRGVDRRPDRGELYRPERDSYTVDVRASDLQLAQLEPLKHPCFSYRAWLYSVLIGVRGKLVRERYKGGTLKGFCVNWTLYNLLLNMCMYVNILVQSYLLITFMCVCICIHLHQYACVCVCVCILRAVCLPHLVSLCTWEMCFLLPWTTCAVLQAL